MMKLDLNFIQKNLPLRQRGAKDDVDLWRIAHKFCINSHSVKALADYIGTAFYQKMYEAVDEQGRKIQRPFFTYFKKTDGTYHFYLKKEGLPLFLSLYSDHLKLAAKEVEEKNNFCDIRYFIRHFKAGTKKLDKPLKTFICENAMDMMYEEEEKGKKVLRPIFQEKGGIFFISKKGMPLFVEKYQEDLEKIGFKNLKSQLTQAVAEKPQNRVTVYELASLLKIQDKEKLKNFLSSPSVHDTFLVKNQKGKLVFDPIVKFYRASYSIEKEDMAAFVNLFSSALINMGADKTCVQIYSNEKQRQKKTENMISIRAFFQKLALAPTALLNKETRATFLNETYWNKKTKSEEPVFVDVFLFNRVCPVFASKEAMLSFLKKNRAFFEKRGASAYRIDSILGKQTIEPWQDDYVLMSQLNNVLKTRALNCEKIIKYCLKDTYSVVQEDGTEVQKPLFFVTRYQDKGQLMYAMDKSAVDVFVKRYGPFFKMNTFLLDSYEQKKKISSAKVGYLNMYQFWDILGRSYQSQFKKLLEYVKEIYLTEKFVKTHLAKSEVRALTFRPMQAHNKKITLYVDEEGIAPFVQKHYDKLLEMGFRKNRLDLALNYKKGLFIKRPSGRFVRADSSRIKE